VVTCDSSELGATTSRNFGIADDSSGNVSDANETSASAREVVQIPKRRRAFRLTPGRHYARQHFVVLDVTWRIDEALKVARVIVGLLNVGARVRHNSLTRTPERQQEKVHPRRFRPTQQMDRAIARGGLIISKAEVNQIAQVGLGLLDGDNSPPDTGNRVRLPHCGHDLV